MAVRRRARPAATVVPHQLTAGGPVRVDAIKVHGFRCLMEIELELGDAQTTVLYGANGCGKSAALDCIATVLSQLAARIQSPHGRGRLIATRDIRQAHPFAFLGVTVRLGTRVLLLLDTVSRAGKRTVSLGDLVEGDEPPATGSLQEAMLSSLGKYREGMVAAVQALREALLAYPDQPLPVLVH